ncbi:Hypothetical protein CINCED_3A023223 [Cinara cedri]|uniref:Uncharacterized protein n=1 Tax=Cinara cedri TaxID=506608 RepID=A0A5E4NIG5_9HEMI|nr:Hypothetical protein CINCED_3A023223 [Cinara cedri]
MGLTSDDATLITCAVDGSMCIWAVQDEKPAVKPLEHILVSSKRLSRKIDVIEKLTDRLDELKELFDEETDKLGKEYDEKLRDLNEQHALAEKQLKDEHKKMVAMLEANETQLKNEIDTRTEEHDTDLNTLIEDYENKIYRADKAYDALDKKMSDIKDESKKKADINVLVHKQTIQELDEQLIKDLKKRDDDFLKFKEDLINEKNQICVEIDEFDNQGYREVLELNTKYTAKLKKWTKKTQNAKDEMKVFEKNLNKAEKVRQDMKHLVDKYQEDIKQKIISNKELDEDILEKEMELQKCGNLIKEKDSLMSLEQLTLKDVEEQISESKFAREDQEKIIEPLKDEQVNLDIVISEMQKLLNETDLEIEKIKMSYASIEDKIKSSRKQVKQDKETALAQDELILSARVEIYKISSSTAPEKQKIALKNLLHSKLANENYLADDVNSELLRQRQFYERCLTHLTRRVSASQMKKPALYKLIEENERLVKDLSKLKEEAETNRVQYNELVNSLRQSKKK